MKMFLLLAACLAVSQAYPSALYSTGSSSSTRKQDSAGNYAFAYSEQGHTGGSTRSEKATPHGVEGSYTLNVGDGRHRVVKYVADAAGFRAFVSTNEPGTEAKSPASVSLSAPGSYKTEGYLDAAPAYSSASYSAPGYNYAAPSYSGSNDYGGASNYAKVAPASSGYSTSIHHEAAPQSKSANRFELLSTIQTNRIQHIFLQQGYGYGKY